MPWEQVCKLRRNLQKMLASRMRLLTAWFVKFFADKLHSILPDQSYYW